MFVLRHQESSFISYHTLNTPYVTDSDMEMGNDQHTFIIIKPDSLQRGLCGDIKEVEQKWFRLVATMLMQASEFRNVFSALRLSTTPCLAATTTATASPSCACTPSFWAMAAFFAWAIILVNIVEPQETKRKNTFMLAGGSSSSGGYTTAASSSSESSSLSHRRASSPSTWSSSQTTTRSRESSNMGLPLRPFLPGGLRRGGGLISFPCLVRYCKWPHLLTRRSAPVRPLSLPSLRKEEAIISFRTNTNAMLHFVNYHYFFLCQK